MKCEVIVEVVKGGVLCGWFLAGTRKREADLGMMKVLG